MRTKRLPKTPIPATPSSTDQEHPDANLFGFFGLLYKVSQRNKQKALESEGQKTEKNSKQ